MIGLNPYVILILSVCLVSCVEFLGYKNVLRPPFLFKLSPVINHGMYVFYELAGGV